MFVYRGEMNKITYWYLRVMLVFNFKTMIYLETIFFLYKGLEKLKSYVQKDYVSKILGFYIPGRTSCKIVSSYTEI